MRLPTAFVTNSCQRVATMIPLWNTRHCYLMSLMLLAQRTPLIRHLLDMRLQLIPNRFADVLKFSIPIGVHVGVTHTLTGATGVVPAGNSKAPAEATVGETFSWVFRSTGEKAKSYSVTGLPPGVEYPGVVQSTVSSFTGVPTEPGQYKVKIIGWEKARQRGRKTPAYTLTVNVTGADLSPYEEWQRIYWNGAELEDATISGPHADPDGDRLSNLVEYASGGDPSKAVPAEHPKPTMEMVNDVPHITIRYPYVSRQTDVQTVVEMTADLQALNWSPLEDGVNGVTIQQSTDAMIVNVPTSAAKGFIRLRVEQP